jgi:hypothetical protein
MDSNAVEHKGLLRHRTYHDFCSIAPRHFGVPRRRDTASKGNCVLAIASILLRYRLKSSLVSQLLIRWLSAIC